MYATFLSGDHFLTGLMALGMGWAFLHADSESSTTKALALALAMTGASIFARLMTLELVAAGPLPAWTGLLVVPGALAFVAAFEWTSRVRATIPAGALQTWVGDSFIRIAQVLVIFYAVAAIAYPRIWVVEFLPGLQGSGEWSAQTKWMFAVPLGLAMALWANSMVLCLNRRPDAAERVRLIAVLLACPLIASGLVLPLSLTPTTTTLGLIVLLTGALRHAQLHGRRGLFLGRFLSPQVASMVNREGLRAAMQEDCYPISIVCCDWRGFTAFASASESHQVLQLLREYYDAAGTGVQAVEGTIKDYAGDGVLILIGAPVPMDNHAERAITLAEHIRTEVGEVIARWSTDAHPIGIGVGVASGPVTVGIIGGESRLEYAAVGQSVNLAARLCEQAAASEILIDAATVDLVERDLRDSALLAHQPLNLKGFRDPVASFSLAQAQTLAQ